jgi:hypothetical protein
MMDERPTTIEPLSLQEETLPSGKKSLRLIFKQRFGAARYEWTPPWKGDYGTEKLLFKALEVEEWNDYDGVWSGELKQASTKVPALDEMRLPVRIRVGEIVGPMKMREAPVEIGYRLAVELLNDDKRAWQDQLGKKTLLCIGDVKIPLESLSGVLFPMALVRGMAMQLENVYESGEEDAESGTIGVRFHVYLKSGAGKADYQAFGKELAAGLRSFIRKSLGDHQAVKKGFEDAESRPNA